ncbi:hypothetical protein [Streptomyces prunicolor]
MAQRALGDVDQVVEVRPLRRRQVDAATLTARQQLGESHHVHTDGRAE